MAQAPDDVFGKIEAAVDDWTHSVAAAHQDLSAQIERARHRLDAQPSGAVAGLDEISRGLAEYNKTARTATERLTEVIHTFNALRTRGANSAAPMTDSSDATDRLDQLHNEFIAIKESLAGIPLLSFKIDELRERVIGDGGRRATPSSPGMLSESGIDSLRDELERALHERQDAQDEIINLRAEVDLLRRANASLCLTQEQERKRVSIQAAVSDTAGHKRRMGMILVDAGIISHTQLDEALSEQLSNPHKRLGTILIEKGYTSERIIAEVLAAQLQLPLITLADKAISPDVASLITKKVATHNMCIPVEATDTTMVLAMANPLDLIAIEDVEMLSNRRAEPAVAPYTEVLAAIQRSYA